MDSTLAFGRVCL
ncbi:hypothetical protein LINGRAHAP2_LOCUS13672 [Linum grandiflorum]